MKKEFALELNDLREEYSLEKESLLDDIREQRRARILLVRSVFLVYIIHVGGTRCVTWSIDRIIQRHACITWGVELIRAIFFIFFLYV